MTNRELLHALTALVEWMMHIEPMAEEYSIDLDKEPSSYEKEEIRKIYSTLFPEETT